MQRRLAIATALGILAASAIVSAHAEERAIVVELFTSQGCSSCPAADRLLGQMAQNPGIVALSLPVDYWDYLGWKDTLANPRHTARQRGYARGRGDRDVYTPQAVINGTLQTLGSDKPAIEAAIRATQADPATPAVAVKVSVSRGEIDVAVPASPRPVPEAEVWLCELARAVPVEIGHGENSGRTIVYHNVVRRWVRLGTWDGAHHSFQFPTEKLAHDGTDAIAVLVQKGSIEHPGPILGAASQSLN